MPSGLFKKEGERWVVNLPNPPAGVTNYHGDHAKIAGALHVPDDAGRAAQIVVSVAVDSGAGGSTSRRQRVVTT